MHSKGTRRKAFFFQAEDGIRDYKVTGVQTCALPISFPASVRVTLTDAGGGAAPSALTVFPDGSAQAMRFDVQAGAHETVVTLSGLTEIGRASWRGRGEVSVGAGSLKKKKNKSTSRAV